MIKWNENTTTNDSDYWFQYMHFICAKYERYIFKYNKYNVYCLKVLHKKCIYAIELNFRKMYNWHSKKAFLNVLGKVTALKVDYLVQRDATRPFRWTVTQQLFECQQRRYVYSAASRVEIVWCYCSARTAIKKWYVGYARCVESAMLWWRPCG